MEELPDGWERAELPPAWVRASRPDASGWRNVGERRWLARLANVFNPDLLLLLNETGAGYIQSAACFEDERHQDDTGGRLFAAMQQRLDYEALPGCVAPSCAAKGEAQFFTAEIGHLAGRVYAAGDEIRMCWKHSNDVLAAGEGLDNIAEWLRPDAQALDMDAVVFGRFDGLTDADIRRARARLPRLMQRAERPR